MLRALGVTGQVRQLPEPAPTAVTAARQLGCEVGAIANSLVFNADGAPLLVLTRRAPVNQIMRHGIGQRPRRVEQLYDVRGGDARGRVVDVSCFGTHMIRVGVR